MHPEETRVYVAILTLSCLSIALVACYITLMIRHQQKNAAAYQYAMQEEMNLLEAQGSRMAADLHDGVNAGLIVAKLKLSLLSLQDEQQQLIVEEADACLANLSHTIRAISQQLMPLVLQQNGLKAAIEDLLGPLYECRRYEIYYHWEAGECPLPPETVLHLYRMIQEMLNNIVKHANASAIEISAENTQRRFSLTVADNVIGFSEASLSNSPGLGLRNITIRANLIQAKLYKNTDDGNGTCFRIEVPMEA